MVNLIVDGLLDIAVVASGFGVGKVVWVCEGVGFGVGLGVGVAEAVGAGEGFATTTPLLHTNFFPDLVQV